MILVDKRGGSGPLQSALEQAGLPCTETLLAFGDFAFEGKGPNGTTLQIGIEYKTLPDFISSVRSGRLTGHQLRGMRDGTYKPDTPGIRVTFDRIWLVIEGDWQADDHGRVCTYKGPKHGWKPVHGGISAPELEKRIIGLEVRAGVYVWPTRNAAATVRYLTHLYRDLTDGAWESHTSHLAPHNPESLEELTPFQDAVMKWPGVGLAVSKAAQKKFGSLRRAMTAPLAHWADLTMESSAKTHRRFGEANARKVCDFLVKSYK